MTELGKWLLDNWAIVAGIITAFLTWHKDYIFRKLNRRKGNAEASQAEKQVDTVYISNSEKLVEIYGKSMDDLLKRNEATIASIKNQYEQDLKKMQDRYAEERALDKEEDKKLQESLTQAIESEKNLGKTVKELKNQISRLSQEVKKLTDQLNYYREHSDLDLPEELQ